MRATDNPTRISAPNRNPIVSTAKLKILNAIYRGHKTQKAISEILKRANSTISEHIKALKQLNLIFIPVRSSTQFLELTEQGEKLAKSFCDSPKTEQFVNHHNFRVELAIKGTKSIEDWGFINRGTHKNKYRKFGSQGFNVEITNNKVLLYLYNIFAQTAEEARSEALNKIADAIEYLYKHHRIKVVPKFKTLTQHIAYNNTPLAEAAKLAGLHYKGKTMHCDQSGGAVHQEFVDPKKAYADARFWAKITEERIENRISPLEQQQLLASTISNLHNLSEQAVYHERNIASHVNAINTMSASLEKLTAIVEELARPSLPSRLWKWITKTIKEKLAFKQT